MNTEEKEYKNYATICRFITERLEGRESFPEIFGIPVASAQEEGTPVVLSYYRGERSSAVFNGGSVLKDESPWRVVGRLSRYVIHRGAWGYFEIRLLYVDNTYKLRDIVFW